MKGILFAAGFLLVMFCAGSDAGQSSPIKEGAMGHSGQGVLLVVSQGNHTVSMIDPASGRTLAALPTAEIRAHEVAVSPDGRFAYLPIYGDSGVGMPGTDGRSIDILDLEKKALTGSIDLGRPVRPHCAEFGPDGLLYVSAELDNSVDVVDPAQGKRVASIPTQKPESHMLAITKDGRRAYTANVESGTVSVLDLVARKPLGVIPVAGKVQRISLSTDDRWVFTADQGQPRLAVIDTASQKVAKWVSLPGIGYGSAATSDGRSLLVALPSAGQVAVVDLARMAVARTIAVPSAPQEILVRPDEPVAYISCNHEGKVAVLDLKQWRVSKLIDAGPGADGLAWAAAK